jgi:hypothetical protein
VRDDGRNLDACVQCVSPYFGGPLLGRVGAVELG